MDSCSSFSASDFGSESGSFEFGFFSSSSSFVSTSSLSFFSDGDLWSETSLSSDDDLSIQNTRTISNSNESGNKTFDTQYEKITDKMLLKTSPDASASTVDNFLLKNDENKNRLLENESSGNHEKGILDFQEQITSKVQEKLQKDFNNTVDSDKDDNNNPFCDICGEVFNSQASLDVHKLNHLVSETYTCEICEHVSKNREDYVLHFRIHDKNSLAFSGNSIKKKKFPSMPYRCDTCGKNFRFSSSFKRHVEKHALSHICNICKASFPTQLLCHQHKLQHAKKKVHKCEVCSKIFQRPHQLTIHMQVHKNDKKYHCKECDTTYCYKTSLMRHSLKYHSPNSPKFQCDLCGELFKTKKMLNGHVILHTAKKLIECADCSQTFKYRSSYHRHRVIHQSSKPFRCNNCGRLFKSESLLKIHKAQHVVNDEFVCTICNKSFGFQSFLDQHMLIHEDMGNKNNSTDQSEE